MTRFMGRDNSGDRWWQRDDGLWAWGETPQDAESGLRTKAMPEADAQRKYGPIPDHTQDWDPPVGTELPRDWDDSLPPKED